MRSRIAYYFDEDPDAYVPWDSPEASEEILENRVVGEYFDKLEFWGSNGLINISLSLGKGQNILDVDTSIFTRN
jgi:hypothetical protein